MCGILGIVARHQVAPDLFHGLCQLQHRGQDAVGIATYDLSATKAEVLRTRGLVTDCVDREAIERLTGEWGIGHVRYSTSGLSTHAEVQPFTEPSPIGNVSIGYNGNIVNCLPVKRELEANGSHFNSSSDAEVLIKQLTQNTPETGSDLDRLRQAVIKVYERIEGAYSVIGLVEGKGMFAFRDPQGLRPLVMGDCQDGYAFSSETYALSHIGCTNLIDIRPGELVWVDAKGSIHREWLYNEKHSHCAFEYVYFTKGNGVIEGKDVYQARAGLGRSLAQKVKERDIRVDVVTAVPTTSHPAALAMAWELRVRIEEGFIRRDHSGRTFIMPSQSARERAVNSKLAPVASVFQGRDVLIVDDSIVRGTVSRRIIRMARQCGARKVYFAATFPPISHPCFYGIDMHSPEELIARGRSISDIEKALGADAVIYNTVDDLKEAIGLSDLCMACCDGRYPTRLEGVTDLQASRREHQSDPKPTLAGVG